MAQRTIASPGVQINEVDSSLRIQAPVGVGILIMGFASEGPTDEVIQVTSIEEYTSIYGLPYTAAERYAYHNVAATLDSPANVFFSRLPYGKEGGNIFSDTYSALVYPVIPDDGNKTYQSIKDDGLDPRDENVKTLYIAEPKHVKLTRRQYEKFINNEVEWDEALGKEIDLEGKSGDDLLNEVGKGGLVIINKSKTTINELFEGYYIGITDNRITEESGEFRDIERVESINRDNQVGYTQVPASRLDFPLTANSTTRGSISEVIENITPFDIGTDEYKDILNIGVFKLSRSQYSTNEIKLGYTLAEGYYGSFDNDREIPSATGGSNDSLFLEVIDDESTNIQFFVNPNLAEACKLSIEGDSYPEKAVRKLDEDAIKDSTFKDDEDVKSIYLESIYPLGAYKETRSGDKSIGNIPTKVERVFSLVENRDLIDIDLTVEAGLGTIHTSTQILNDGGNYDETKSWPDLDETLLSSELGESETQQHYATIYNLFENFARSRRKDHLFIADPIRQILIRGENGKILTQTDDNDIPKNFSKHIHNALRQQFKSANSSYSTQYGTWAMVFDNVTNKRVWVPYSGFAASLMANMPNIWDAPAGLTRGINRNILDIAYYPNQRERDQLYKISVNPVTFFPNEGFITWGQKTSLKKPSAFDRINVRRVFLYLEKAVDSAARYFVHEPNNLFTRTRVINTLTPLFESVKQAGGIADYMIIASEANNTPEVVEQNEMVINIYIKPQKTAEFIIVNFHATRQDVTFQETMI